MIHFFYANQKRTATEVKMLYQLSGKDLPESFDELVNLKVTYKGSPIEVNCLEITPRGLIIQLLINDYFRFSYFRIDESSNCYKTSNIRKFLKSEEFSNNFNSEFLSRVKISEVHTEDYITQDKFYLLSHEEVGMSHEEVVLLKRFKPNQGAKKLDGFSSDFSRIRVIDGKKIWWWLRSASSNYDDSVGCVDNGGYVYGYCTYNSSACLPVCLIT